VLVRQQVESDAIGLLRLATSPLAEERIMRRTLATTAVSEIMDREPPTVGPQATVGELVKLLETECVDAMPVADGNGVLRGIVTSLDLLRLVRPDASLGMPGMRSLPARRVESVMRPGVITLEPGDPVVAAVDLMVETRLHMVPVVKRDAAGPILIGVVRQRLLLSKMLRLFHSRETVPLEGDRSAGTSQDGTWSPGVTEINDELTAGLWTPNLE
jgi:CBS-domain-containing membrane protein